MGASPMRTDARNIARVIAGTTKKSVEEVERTILEGTVLDAAQAKDWGLVQEIKEELFPPGSRIITIAPVVGQARGPQPLVSDPRNSIDRIAALSTATPASGTILP